MTSVISTSPHARAYFLPDFIFLQLRIFMFSKFLFIPEALLFSVGARPAAAAWRQRGDATTPPPSLIETSTYLVEWANPKSFLICMFLMWTLTRGPR
jgi:hypothetical protein